MSEVELVQMDSVEESEVLRTVSLEHAANSSIPIINSECSVRLNCLQKEILAVCAHSDKRIFVGSEDTSIRLWDIPSQNWVWSMKDHTKGINSIIIDRKRQLMISGSQDGGVRLWDISACETANKQMDVKSKQLLAGHKKPITGLRLDEISGTLFSASEDGTVKGWNMETNECIMSIIDIKNIPRAVAVHGKFLYVGTPDGLQKRNIATGELLKDIPTPSPIECLESAPENNLLFCGLANGSIYSWNEDNDTLTVELKGKDGDWSIHSMVVHRQRLYCGTSELAMPKPKKGITSIRGRIIILDLSTPKHECIQKLDAHADKITSLTAFDNYVFSGSRDQMVHLWNLTQAGYVPSYEHEKEVVCSTATGTHLFTSSGKRTITSFEIKSRKKLKEFKGHEQTVSCLVESDGLLFSGSLDRTVRIWDSLTGECLRILPKAKAAILCLAVADELLYVGYGDRCIGIFDIQSGESRGYINYAVSREARRASMAVDGLTRSPSVDQLQASDGNAEPTLKSMQEKSTTITSIAVIEETRTLPDPAGKLRRLSTSSHLFSSTGSGITAWQPVDDKYFKFFKNGNIAITLMKVHRARHKIWLFAGDKDGYIHQWDLEQFFKLKFDFQDEQIPPLRSWRAHKEGVKTIHIDDNSIISSAKDSIRIWDCAQVLDSVLPTIRPRLVLTMVDFGKKGLFDVCVQDDLIFVALGNIIKQFNLSILKAPEDVIENISVPRLRKFMSSPSGKNMSQSQWTELLYFLLAYGLTDPVKYVMKKQKININDPDDKGDNGLLHAVRSERFSMLSHLSTTAWADQLKVEEEDYKIQDFLCAQSRDDNVVYLKTLSKCGVDLSLVSVQLVTASFLNKSSPLKFLKFWIKSQKINSRDQFGRTPLHYAVFYGNLNATKMLHQDDRIQVNVIDMNGMTPFQLGLYEAINPLPGQRGNRSSYELTTDRYDCIELLLSVTSGPKRPEILKRGSANSPKYSDNSPVNSQWSGYDMLLIRYAEDRELLNTEKLELKQAREKEMDMKQFERTNEIVDFCNTKLDSVSAYRDQWAIKNFLQVGIPYFIFLILVLIISFGQTTQGGAGGYQLSQSLQNTFGNLDKVGSLADIYTWTSDTLVAGLGTLEWNSPTDPTDPTGTLPGHTLVSLVQMRQLRTSNLTCDIPQNVANRSLTCYTTLRFEEDKSTYGPGTSAFQWQDVGPSFTTPSSNFYPAGGYIVELGPDANSSSNILSDLQSGGWLDKNTRIVYIDFSVYSTDLNLFGHVTTFFELPASGLLSASQKVVMFKGFRYQTGYDKFLLAMESLCIIYFFFAFVVNEARELWREKGRYIFDKWNYYEITLIAFFFTIIGIHVTGVHRLNAIDFSQGYTHFIDMSSIASNFGDLRFLYSAFILMSFLRMLKYMKTIPSTGPATQAILDTMLDKNFIIFVIIFAFVIMTFSFTLNVALGMDMYVQRNEGVSIMTTIQYAIGGVDYQPLEDANVPYGPIFYIIFTLFIGVTFMNMFIAVLSGVYDDKKQDNVQRWQVQITNAMVGDVLSRIARERLKILWSEIKQLFSNAWNQRPTHDGAEIDANVSDPNVLIRIREKFSVPVHVDEEEKREGIDFDEIDEIAQNLNTQRSDKTNMDIYEQVESMRSDIADLKAMLSEALKKK